MRTRVVVCAVLLALAAAAPAGVLAAGVAAAGVPSARVAAASGAGAGTHHPRHRCRVHRRCAHPSRAAHRPGPRKSAKSTAVPAPAPVTAPTPAPLPTPAPAPAPARVQVSAREFSLTLSRPQVTAGQAVIEFVDAGQDPHDLHIRSVSGGDDVAAFALGLPGTHADQAVTLAPGTYMLYCSLPGHEALGMHATLTVG